VLDILHLGLGTDNMHTLRMCACLVVYYSWYNRADTGRSHVTLTNTFMTINTKSKKCARNVDCQITRRVDPRHDPGSLTLWFITPFNVGTPSATLTMLPQTFIGRCQDTLMVPSIITKWLWSCLKLVHCAPPAGESWSGHSMQAGGASAGLAIGVYL